MKPSIKFKTVQYIALVVWVALRTNGQPPPGTLWYNGDFVGHGGAYNQISSIPFVGPNISQVYDDFSIPQPFGWNVNEVFSDNILCVECQEFNEATGIIGAVWEIRQGVSMGNPGVLIAQGFTVTPVVTATGRSDYWPFSNLLAVEYRVEVQGLNLFLSPGAYYLNVTPIGLRYSVLGNSITTGADCVGTPCGNNGNAFNAASDGTYWQPLTGDFAMGMVGNTNNNPQLVVGGSIKQGFEIPLPINGLAGIEDRSGQPGGAYTITMMFNETIASVARASASCGKAQSTSIDGNTLIINLTRVSCNASHITVTANDVKDSAGINLGTACITVGLLLGDVNGDGVVDAADLDIVNSQIGQTTNEENFRSDINNDGVISGADLRIVTQQQGTRLP
jgi:hypothetical protein